MMFRGDVSWSAAQSTSHRVHLCGIDSTLVLPIGILFLNGFCEAPIHNEGLSQFSDHDIRRLDIPVNYTAAMREGDGAATTLKDREQAHDIPAGVCVPRIGSVNAVDNVFERDSLENRSREVQGPIFKNTYVIHGRDVGMLELRPDLSLAQEPLPKA